MVPNVYNMCSHICKHTHKEIHICMALCLYVYMYVERYTDKAFSRLCKVYGLSIQNFLVYLELRCQKFQILNISGNFS